jgi:hypothetical protein
MTQYERSLPSSLLPQTLMSYLSSLPMIADWIEPFEGAEHNFDSASSEGTNRFATLLLYLSEVEDGGETLFTEAEVYRPEGEEVMSPHEDALVRESTTPSHFVLTLPYLTLPYLTLPYLTLPYLTLPYLTLPYLTLPYSTLLSSPPPTVFVRPLLLI